MITKYDKDAVSAVLITTNVGDVHIKDEPKLFFFIVHQNFAHVLFVDFMENQTIVSNTCKNGAISII